MIKSAYIYLWSFIIDVVIEVIYCGRKTAFIVLGYSTLSRIQCIYHLLGYLEWFGSFLCRLGPILAISLSIAKHLKRIKLLFFLL